MDRPLSDKLLLAGNQHQADRLFWLNKFSDDFHRGVIPYDRPPANVPPSFRVVAGLTVPPRVATSCLRLANGSPHNLYVLLSSGVALLVHKYTGEREIVLGCPVTASEADPDSLVNTVVPLRVEIDGATTFMALLKRMKTVTVEAIKHQNWPIELLVEACGGTREGAHFPLFDVAALQKGLHLERFFEERGPNLYFAFEERGGSILVDVHYNEHLYDAATVDDVFRHFCALLEQAMDHVGSRPLADYVTASPDELSRVLELSRHDATYPETTITRLFEESAARFPTRIALQFGSVRVTYAELNRRANRLARVLRRAGVRTDRIVGIYLERSIDAVVAAIAVLKAGGAYLPLDPEYPSARVRHMLDDSGAVAVVTRTSLAPALGASATVIALDDAANQGSRETSSEDDNLDLEQAPGDLAYVIYTSGTTGRPKGAMIEHRNVVRLLRNSVFQFAFDENDVWTFFHSFCFDFSVWEMYGALLNGGKLIVLPRAVTIDVAEFRSLLETERVTVLNQTPSAFYRLLDEERKRSDHGLALRYVVFGGEALHPARLEGWRRVYPEMKLVNMYGITETTVHVTYKEITDRDIEHRSSNVGRPIPTTSTYVLDTRRRPVAVGMIGEMFVAGAGVGRGYVNNPELTAQRFLEDPFSSGGRLYRTGDFARWRRNGELEYIGRMDQQVKIRGHRIELVEIEAVAAEHPDIANAVVVPVPAAGDDDRALCLYWVGAPGARGRRGASSTIRDHLEKRLPHFMVPSFLVELPELPLTESGKLNVRALPDPRQAQGDRDDVRAAPRTNLERQLVSIWSTVLALPESDFGVNDRFFDLGGTSFNVIALNERVQALVGRSIPTLDYFQFPTIAKFVQHLAGTEQPAAAPETAPVAGGDGEGEDAHAAMALLAELADG